MRKRRSHRVRVHAVVVIGASAGALGDLQQIVAAFPSSLPAAVFVVVHTSPDGAGRLWRVLARAAVLPTVAASDRAAIEDGRIYVAPPDHHMVVADRHVDLGRGPRENGFRPAVDPLFRSAAEAYRRRVVGVILSGALSDGAKGLQAIKRHGGVTVVQDPDDALIPGMPISALARVQADYVLSADRIAREIVGIVHRVAGRSSTRSASHRSRDAARIGRPELLNERDPHAGTPSEFTCPECGSALWRQPDRVADGYRCHVGHTFDEDALVVRQAEHVDRALWEAVRSLEEATALRGRMAARMRRHGLHAIARGFEAQANELRQRADAVWGVLHRGLAPPDSLITTARRAARSRGAEDLLRQKAHGQTSETQSRTTASADSTRHRARG